jgi:hypothetical protein
MRQAMSRGSSHVAPSAAAQPARRSLLGLSFAMNIGVIATVGSRACDGLPCRNCTAAHPEAPRLERLWPGTLYWSRGPAGQYDVAPQHALVRAVEKAAGTAISRMGDGI